VALLAIVFLHELESGLVADGLVGLGCRRGEDEDQGYYARAHGGSMDLWVHYH
jgi:hypothetical protein